MNKNQNKRRSIIIEKNKMNNNLQRISNISSQIWNNHSWNVHWSNWLKRSIRSNNQTLRNEKYKQENQYNQINITQMKNKNNNKNNESIHYNLHK